MAKSRFHIETKGMKGMENDFRLLGSEEPYAYAKQRLDDALQAGFEGTQHAVPVGDGDYRRPAGALRDSGRTESSMSGDVWTGMVAYGYEGQDPAVNYAAYVRYGNLRKYGVDFLGDPMEAATELFDRAVNAPWDEVFGHGD